MLRSSRVHYCHSNHTLSRYTHSSPRSSRRIRHCCSVLVALSQLVFTMRAPPCHDMQRSHTAWLRGYTLPPGAYFSPQGTLLNGSTSIIATWGDVCARLRANGPAERPHSPQIRERSLHARSFQSPPGRAVLRSIFPISQYGIVAILRHLGRIRHHGRPLKNCATLKSIIISGSPCQRHVDSYDPATDHSAEQPYT